MSEPITSYTVESRDYRFPFMPYC